jgi:hypothetical protein
VADDFERLRATLDGRFCLAAGVGTLLALVVLGVPSAVIPNPFFIRMTPTEAARRGSRADILPRSIRKL